MKQRRLPARPSQIIDRSRNVYFNYEGKRILAYPGDTVASALHASGIDIFGRSFKYHRPRGLLCVSGRCPNCMMNVDGAPNIRACACAAADGMNVAGQNAWPSVENDALSALQYFDRLMPVGFYYKTLIRPKAAWHLAEPVIRRVAGLGTVDTNRIPDTEYEHVNAYTDVAVIGGGPAGLSAASPLRRPGRGSRWSMINRPSGDICVTTSSPLPRWEKARVSLLCLVMSSQDASPNPSTHLPESKSYPTPPQWPSTKATWSPSTRASV